jgi:hypothetical protein
MEHLAAPELVMEDIERAPGGPRRIRDYVRAAIPDMPTPAQASRTARATSASSAKSFSVVVRVRFAN